MPATSPDSQTQMRLAALAAGLRVSGVCVLHQDNEHRFDLAENLPPHWPRPALDGQTEAQMLPAEIADNFADAFDLCRLSGAATRTEFEITDSHGRRRFEAQMLPDTTGVTTIVTDTTEDRARDAAVASLLREVSHRSKNLLAIVQSVAMQTAHHSGSIHDFLDRFRGRLHALSSTQDLVTESDWRGTHLHALVTSQLARIGPELADQVRITGTDPLLGPNAALHIGLAIHELGVNAMLHGALADAAPGHIWIDAGMSDADRTPSDLVIQWREGGFSASDLVRTPHFGTLVLERIVPLSVGGTADFSITAGNVLYRLVVPADQFES